MDRYKSSKRKLALLRKNLAERERKVREYQASQERKALVWKIFLSSVAAVALVLVAFFAY